VNDGASTTKVFQSALWSYSFGFESLVKIERHGHGQVTIYHDIPSLDAQGLVDDLNSGQCSISDLNEYVRLYARTIGILKEIQRRGETVWASDSWRKGRG